MRKLIVAVLFVAAALTGAVSGCKNASKNECSTCGH